MESRIQETLTIPEEDRLKTNDEDPNRLPEMMFTLMKTY